MDMDNLCYHFKEPLPPTYIFTQALVTQVLQEASQGKIGRCQALGFSPELVQRLQGLSPTELHQLFQSPFLWVKHTVDETALERILETIGRNMERENLINRVLRLGGTSPMMAQFFGVSHTNTAERRRAMGISVKAGRMPALTDEQRHEVWERWVSLVKQQDESCGSSEASLSNISSGLHLEELQQLDLMLLIAEEQNIPVALVWMELNAIRGGQDEP